MNSCKSKGKPYWRFDVILVILWAVVMPADEMATLERVVDGDTIWVHVNGTIESIRYLGVNAPERDTHCGEVATRIHRRLVQGKRLRLVPDADVSNRDAFGRLLRYVYADGFLINAELVKRGVARARRYEPGIDYYPQFAKLEKEAQANGRGCL